MRLECQLNFQMKSKTVRTGVEKRVNKREKTVHYRIVRNMLTRLVETKTQVTQV
jgi:hypothetical protein